MFTNVLDKSVFLKKRNIKQPSSVDTKWIKDRLDYPNKVAAEIMVKLADFVREDITTLEINYFVEKEILNKNCVPSLLGYKGYPFTICVSINEELCHGLPSERVLKKGDIVNIDFVVSKDGWLSDISKTFIIGNSKYRKLVEVSEKCMMTGIKACGPGVSLKKIAYEVNKEAENNGFFVCKEFCGHGLKRNNLHADPKIIYDVNFQNLDKEILREGQVITMEPIITEKPCKPINGFNNWVFISDNMCFSANHERTILITNNGCEVLNDF